MKLKDIFKDKQTLIFKVVNDDVDNELDMDLEPTDLTLIPDENGYFIIRALEVHKGKVTACFMDMSSTERISDIVIRKGFLGNLRIKEYYNYEGIIIPAVASNCFGVYDLYYSKENPQIGINVLKDGIEKAENKAIIAEDLGYILRDEHRNEEAIEVFQKSLEFGSSSPYPYLEISHLYERLGDLEMKEKYHKLFLDNGGKIINIS